MAEQQSDPRDLSKVYPLRDLPVSESPGEVMEKMTIEVIEKKHKDYLDAWKDSPTYKKYSEIIGSKALKQGNLKVTQCMCLGTGSFTTGESGKAQLLWRVRDMAMSQLVVFESFMELLKEKYTFDHVYLQDPVYNALDEHFLKKLGYTILQTPESDKYMSKTTFLFIPSATWEVEEASLNAAFPAIYIGPKLVDRAQNQMGNERGQLYEDFLNKRAIKKFPHPAELQKDLHINHVPPGLEVFWYFGLGRTICLYY